MNRRTFFGGLLGLLGVTQVAASKPNPPRTGYPRSDHVYVPREPKITAALFDGNTQLLPRAPLINREVCWRAHNSFTIPSASKLILRVYVDGRENNWVDLSNDFPHGLHMTDGDTFTVDVRHAHFLTGV